MLLRAKDQRSSPARRLARLVIPRVLRQNLARWATHVRTSRSPDRIYLRTVLLPQIAARGRSVLLVGCQSYTRRDPSFLRQRGVTCWTIDVDPAAVRWGASGHHVVAPIQNAAARFEASMFDTVVLSGVFGFGLDDHDEQEAALAACAAIIEPDGLLVLGWNTDRAANPTTLQNLGCSFRLSKDPQFSGPITFRNSTHVFDFYIRSQSSSNTNGHSP